ncbi:MAG TPA: DUF916 and DUF3324 domain-containing protein [Candidatus Levilactobacillus faecigallinarum]|uniref:DUF916 and DUF3324 domain-containing protein n=1 Tax=Candidatus Levilactobacillus faecigallinarum TaxID=2838638 RepID=A0A9D1QUH6_9LACO|nr:DUF916 and DUF3324 domain-containing protein [Candidatus Levilactobacillus faecigallinarum]
MVLNRRSILITMFFTLFGILLLGFPTLVASADTSAFNVTPLLPRDNAPMASYFQFMTHPDEQRTLHLKITNQGTKLGTYDITPRIATTNSNGYLDYSLDNTNDALPAHTNQLFEKGRIRTTIAPNTTKDIPISFHAPKQSFKGILLAGLTVSQHQTNKTVQKGNRIVARTEYVIALETYQHKPQSIGLPNITFKGARYQLAQALPQITLGITNHSPQLVSQGMLTATLRDAAGKATAKFKKEQLLFAPQSAFGLNLSLNNRQLPAGAYTLVGRLKAHGGGEYPFEFPVEITAAQTRNVKRHAADFAAKPTHNWLLDGAIAALVLVGSGVGYQLGRKRHALREPKHSRNR